MKVETACRRLINEYRSRRTPRAGSLITTVFGDAIAPRGGRVWLGSLIDAMANFGCSDRLVRTSVFRLVRDGWLQSEQVGRRAYYRLTETGRERFNQATHRIYGTPVVNWDGHWCLLLLSGLETSDKELVRRESSWLGFAALSANVLAHPSPNLADLDVSLQRLGVAESTVVLSGQTVRNEDGMRRLAHNSWNLADLSDRYAAYMAMFSPLRKALRKTPDVDERTAFIARTLLIQEYRKILLRDPMLPDELLARDWPGVDAYEMTRELYMGLHQAADRFLSATMETSDGALPQPALSFYARFGGLDNNRLTPKRRRKVGHG